MAPRSSRNSLPLVSFLPAPLASLLSEGAPPQTQSPRRHRLPIPKLELQQQNATARILLIISVSYNFAHLVGLTLRGRPTLPLRVRCDEMKLLRKFSSACPNHSRRWRQVGGPRRVSPTVLKSAEPAKGRALSPRAQAKEMKTCSPRKARSSLLVSTVRLTFSSSPGGGTLPDKALSPSPHLVGRSSLL